MPAWALLTLPDEERQYAGNQGYDDDLRSVYRYDNGVPNSKAIQEGDLALLRDKSQLLGVARIERIESYAGTKTRLRCRNCGLTKLKERKTMSPKYRCECGEETDNPIIAEEPCMLYDAWFGASFVQLGGEFEPADLKAVAPKYNGQHAMQRVDLSLLLPQLDASDATAVSVVLMGAPATSTSRPPATKAPRHSKYRAAARPKTISAITLIVLKRDPALLERALTGHADTQDALAAHLRASGREPSSPEVGVLYDISWPAAGGMALGEVKSLTDTNEVAQLRSGIGQLLDYATQLEQGGDTVTALYLIVERRPTDLARWKGACDRAGITLTWAPDFAAI